jgi:DNA-binding SARP family transcriptional activator
MNELYTLESERARALTGPWINLIDGFRLVIEGAEYDLPVGTQRVLAHLCLFGRPTRSHVAGVLWSDASEERAQANLRSTLWRLQRSCAGLVKTAGGQLSLCPAARTDVAELIDWARRVLAPDSEVVELEGLPTTLHGELLPGWYEDWVLIEREHLRQLRLHALEVLADRLSCLGRYGNALEAAYAAVRSQPLRESAHRTVIKVHLAEGNTVDAVRQYDNFREMLSSELGTLPSRLMTELVRGLRAERRNAVRPRSPGGVRLRRADAPVTRR